jgi:copper resistance protein C
MTPRTLVARVRAGLVVGVIVVAIAAPTSVAAHSELVSSSPPEGAVLSAPPDEIVLTFSEALDRTRSHVTLNDPSGTQVAAAGVDPSDDTIMRLTPPASLAPGAYQIRWTSVAADGDVLQEIVHFTLTPPSPSPSAAPIPSAIPSATASAAASPSATTSPSPAPSAPTTPASSGADVLLPIVAALVVIAVFGWWLLRNRSRGAGRP